MTYLDQIALRLDGTFLSRVAVGCATAALAILTEAENTARHAERLAWARQTILAPEAYAVPLLAWAVVVHAAIAAKANVPLTITDAEILTAVTAALDGIVAPVTVDAPR